LSIFSLACYHLLYDPKLTNLFYFELNQIAESDIAKQAQVTAVQVSRSVAAGARSAQEGVNRFVEGPPAGGASRQAPIDESKKDFWDSFSSLADQNQRREAGGGYSAIGTSAMGKGSRGAAAPAKPKQSDDWEDW
jgi:ADP-ribosylation factor GTPase-activating protein 1